LKILMAILSVQDAVFAEKVEYVMPRYMIAISEHQQFWKSEDLLLCILTKLMKNHESVREWVVQRGDELAWVIEWLRKYQNEPSRAATNGPIRYKIDIPDPNKKQSVVDAARDAVVDLKRKKGETLKDWQNLFTPFKSD